MKSRHKNSNKPETPVIFDPGISIPSDCIEASASCINSMDQVDHYAFCRYPKTQRPQELVGNKNTIRKPEIKDSAYPTLCNWMIMNL